MAYRVLQSTILVTASLLLVRIATQALPSLSASLVTASFQSFANPLQRSRTQINAIRFSNC